MLQVTVDSKLLEVDRHSDKSFSAFFLYEAEPNVSVVAKNSFGQSRATLGTHIKTDRKKRSSDDADYANKSENILLPVWLAQLLNCLNGCLSVCMSV